MIEQLVPRTVAAVATRADRPEEVLFPEEQDALGRAVLKRRTEFVTARSCARQALRQLGIAPVAIPTGSRGEPLWPDGVVGSITHCVGYRACAVARAADALSVGIDAEVAEPLPAGVLEHVAFGSELEMIARVPPALCWDRVLFSAKEAIYKAWYPLAGSWLGFEDVVLSIDAVHGSFSAQLLVPGPVVNGARLTEFHGRWLMSDGIIAAAVTVVPAR